MKKQIGYLIMQTEDVSIYSDELLNQTPSSMKIGGFITAINNYNGERRWKEWKWYQHEDGTMFSDKNYVIDMLANFVGKLHMVD